MRMSLLLPCACSSEQIWFESHSEYSEVAKQCGVGNLAKRINVILGEPCVSNMLQDMCFAIQQACRGRICRCLCFINSSSCSTGWVRECLVFPQAGCSLFI